METVLDNFGRILLPVKLREPLGLHPGSVLDIVEDHGELRLKPVTGEPGLAEKNGVLVFTGRATGDISDAVRQMREKRARRTGLA